METFLQDILFYAVLALVAWILLNDSGGGGKRLRMPAAA
jgi:hypothetical protein